MIHAIPFLGWFIGLICHASMALPFWLCWTVFGIGEKYFYFAPDVYHGIGFWASVGIFTVASVLKSILLPKLGGTTIDTK